jgi:PST family polysaccharide transporter
MTGLQLARQLLQLLSVSILAHRVPPAAYGVVATAVVITNFLDTLRDLGTSEALIREREMSAEIESTAFWLNTAIGATLALVILSISGRAAVFFHEPQLVLVLQFLALGFFLNAVGSVPTALLIRAMAFRKLALCQAAGAITGTAVAVVVAIEGGKLWSLICGGLTITLVTTAALFLVSPFSINATFRPAHARRMLSFGLYLSGSHVFNYFSRNLDNLLVARFLGSVSLGYYQMGYLLMTYPLQNMSSVINQVMYPSLSRVSDNREKIQLAYLRSSALIGLICFPLMLGLAVTAGPFIHVFLGSQWTPVARLLLVFAPLGAAQALYGTVSVIYQSQGRTDLQFKWMLFSSVAYVLSFVVGLRWGIIGVACSYTLVWFLLMIPSFWIPFHLIELSGQRFFRVLWPTLWRSLLMATISASWLLILKQLGIDNPAGALASAVLIGALAYLSLLFLRTPTVVSELIDLLSETTNPYLRKLSTLLSWSLNRSIPVP